LLPQNQTIGHPFIELQQVDSTNNYATALAHAGMAQHGTAVLAHHQSKGKGQRNKSWEADAGKNITTSLIIQPQSLLPSEAFYLSMATAIGVKRFFNNYVKEEVAIKWPNDLYWRDRKAGGILIENILKGNTWKYAIVGIGVNVNQTNFTAHALRPVSLKQLTGKSYDIINLAKELYKFIEEALHQLYADKQSIIDDYHFALYKRNQLVKLKKDSRVFEATIKGVTSTGELITEHGIEEHFQVGEVEWII